MDKRLEGKVAVVASNAGSIAPAVVDKLLAEGAKVAWYVPAEGSMAAGYTSSDSLLLIPVKSFNDGDELKAAEAEVIGKFGTIDIAVTRMTAPKLKSRFPETSADEIMGTFHKVLNTNMFVLQPIVSGMMEKEYGRVIIILDQSGRTGIPGSDLALATAYAGLTGLIRNIATRNGAQWITCNGIAIGDIAGEEEYLNNVKPGLAGKRGTPEDVANAVLYFADKYGAWNTGEIVDLCGGAFSI